jgi:TonB family protein
MSRSEAVGAFMAAFLAVAGPAAAASKPSPHGLGLLAGRVTDEAARERLKAGLADPRPEVRASAVRVINVSGVGALVPAIAAALASETDLAAASEMIRFLGAFERPELDQAILDGVRRLGSRTHGALADAFARRADAAAHIPALRALGLDEPSWLIFHDVATAGATRSPGPLGAAVLRERDAVGWRALLRALRKAEVPLEAGLALEGVRSESEEIRTATYWSLVAEADPGRPPAAALASALAATPEALKQGSAEPVTALAFEVLRRAQGGPPRPLVDTIKAVEALDGTFDAWDAIAPRPRLFDKAERSAISSMVFGRGDALDGWREPPPRADKPAEASPYARVWTATGFPPSFVPDALAATGCDLDSIGTILGGELTHGTDGRPRQVGLIQDGKSKECVEASRILLASSLAPLGVPTGERKSLLLLPDRNEFVRCMDEGARRRASAPQRPDIAGEKRKGGRIQEPKKARDRRPRYPDSARARGIQGVVVLDAEIEPSGCVSQVALLRGIDTSLDLEAIRAVSSWVYTPTLLNGEPVPIQMTVTVNFKLSR